MASSGYVDLSASHIVDGFGNPLAAGWLEVLVTDGDDHPLVVAAGGTGGTIMPNTVAPIAVTAGAIGTGKQVLDTSISQPANCCLRLTVKDSDGKPVRIMRRVQTQTNVTLNLDTYQPQTDDQVKKVITTGPVGINYRGAYQNSTAYAARDAVSCLGSTYYASTAFTSGIGFDASQWSVLSQAGDVTSGQLAVTSAAAAAMADALARGGNLFDKTAVTGGFVVWTTGAIQTGGSDFTSSGFIYVRNAGYVALSIPYFSFDDGGSFRGGWAFYDASYTYISGGTGGSGSILAVPAGAVYLRYYWRNADVPSGGLDSAMVVAGKTLPSTFVPYLQVQRSGQVGPSVSQLLYDGDTLILRNGNLFNPDTYTQGQYVNYQTGGPGYHPDFSGSGFMFCHNAKRINFNFAISGFPGDNGYVSYPGTAFYDKDYNYLSGHNPPNTGYEEIPDGACFFKVSVHSSDGFDKTTAMAVAGQMPSSYVPYGSISTKGPIPDLSTFQPASLWSGKGLFVLGDSITEYNAWYNNLAARTGMTVVFGQGIAGRTAKQALLQRYGLEPGVSSSAESSGMAALTAELANADLVLLEFGTNDCNYTQNNPGTLGTAADPSTTNPATFMSGTRYVIEHILAAKPTVRVAWVGPYLVERIPGQPGGLVNGPPGNYYTNDYVLNTYLPVLSQVLADYSVPLIDMARRSGLNRYNMAHADGSAFWLVDHLHPTQLGYDSFFTPTVSREIEVLAR